MTTHSLSINVDKSQVHIQEFMRWLRQYFGMLERSLEKNNTKKSGRDNWCYFF